MVIGGEARNFAFLGNGDFKTKPGFGVFLSVGAADGRHVQVAELAADPDQRDRHRVARHPGRPDGLRADAVGDRHRRSRASPGLKFSGSIEGIKIDIGKLLDGEFPIIDIASIGVSVKGNMFGGELNAALIGGILRLDARRPHHRPARHDHAGRGPRSSSSASRAASSSPASAASRSASRCPSSGRSTCSAQREPAERHPARAEHRPVDQRLRRRRRVLQDAAVDRRARSELRGPAFQLPTERSRPTSGSRPSSSRSRKQYLLLQANPEMNGFAAAFTRADDDHRPREDLLDLHARSRSSTARSRSSSRPTASS